MSTRIAFENLLNTRDLGGMRTKDGRVIKPGKLIRSGQLHFASDADKETLAGLVGVIADFRTDQEMYEKPDPYLPKVAYHHISILSSWAAGVTWEETAELSDEELFERLQKEPALAKEYMCGIYSSFAANEFYLSQYRKFIELLLEEQTKATLWHCTAGKDRAGFASVIVEELLGVPRPDITADYLQTAVFLKPEIAMVVERLKKRYPAPGAISQEAVAYLFGAEPAFIDAVYHKVEELYGSFDVFLKDGLKVTRAEREQMQKLYLE